MGKFEAVFTFLPLAGHDVVVIRLLTLKPHMR